MLVQEFMSDATDDDNHDTNARDLNRFVSRMSHGTITSVTTGQIVGPISVPGAPLFRSNVDLYIGKVTRNLRG
jgi:hypothetical protein